MKKLGFIQLLVVITLGACTDEEFDPSSAEVMIVEGYLYANQPIEVRLSQLVPFVTDEETFEIEDAQLHISDGVTSYLLTHDEDEPGRYYLPENELLPSTANTYEIAVDYFGVTTSASTVIPDKPLEVSLSVNEIEIEPIESFEDVFDRVEGDVVEVYWENETSEYFYILVENIEFNPRDVNRLNFGGGQPNFTFTTEPTNLDVHNIRPFSLLQYGTYRIIVFKVAQEYVDLYQTADQDSRNLTEPLTNINNGLGIFTSFNSDTVYLEVIEPE